MHKTSDTGDMPSTECIDKLLSDMSASFDEEYGGYGGAPKFPQASEWNLWIEHHFTLCIKQSPRPILLTLLERILVFHVCLSLEMIISACVALTSPLDGHGMLVYPNTPWLVFQQVMGSS